MSQWIRVGKVKEAHGLKGELYVLLFAKESPWLKDLTEFAMAAADEGPFETSIIEKAKPHRDGLIIKSPTLKDRTQAEAKEGLLFYIPQSLFVSKKGEAIYLREIQGFSVQTEAGLVGPIISFSSNGVQDLLVVDRAGTNIEIPFVEDFIRKIDFENRTVWMDLPEGLWE